MNLPANEKTKPRVALPEGLRRRADQSMGAIDPQHGCGTMLTRDRIATELSNVSELR
jgi:hypothetical protein